MEVLLQKMLRIQERFFSINWQQMLQQGRMAPIQLLQQVKAIGYNPTLDEYEKRKLAIFNQLNFFQLISGIIVPVAGLFNHEQLPAAAWLIATLPALVSILVLTLNHHQKYEVALLSYFILYPFFTCVVYINGMNLGVASFFILYGVLSVFFLQDIGYMLFTIAWSMLSYFILAVVLKNYRYQLESVSKALYFFNQFLAIVYIYYGLWLIKKENTGYQLNILKKNRVLHKKNVQILRQKQDIAEKARLLKMQKEELTELNTLKNKLFSVIAHDLRSPMYALRNLFTNVKQYNVPAKEVKAMVPEVITDLNYTIGLMENLLQWAKTQMQASAVQVQMVDVNKLIEEVAQLLHLQAEAKQIYVEHKTDAPVYIMADKEMISLVLRNLLSNAIKFTPQKGSVLLGVNELSSFVEVYVQDTGTGIKAEALHKINQNDYYTTKGTDSESGTGLGLMLCREFLAKNGGQLFIESEWGKGSTISFTLPRAEQEAELLSN